MSLFTCYLGVLLACCALVQGIPPPEASAPAGASFLPAMAQANPFLAKFKAGGVAAASPAAVNPLAAAAAAAPPAPTTTLPPAVNKLIAKYKAAAAAFYPTIPVV